MKNPIWLHVIAQVCLLLILFLISPYWRYNLSPSAPLGVYLVLSSKPYNGCYCLVSSEDLPFHFSFLPPFLIKVLAFSQSEHLLVNDLGVFVNGRFVCSRPVKQGAPGFIYNAAIPAGYGILLNPHKDSFDSRYFGPVPLSSLTPLALVIRF